MLSFPLKLAVLVSGSGTTLQNLIDRIGAGELDAKINIVIGSRAGLGGLERASAARLMTYIVDRANAADVGSFSKQVFALCEDAEVDLVCLAGWLSLIGSPVRGERRAIVSFYGVRGIGSIYYIAYACNQLQLPEARQLWAAMAFCILVSTLTHGLSSGLVQRRLERFRKGRAGRTEPIEDLDLGAEAEAGTSP